MITREYRVDSSTVPGLSLYLRHRARADGLSAGPKTPILFVHNLSSGGIIFDCSAPGYSWLEAMARRGHAAFYVDFRGYGRTGKPFLGDDETGLGRPYCRASEAVEDLADAVEFVCAETGYERVHLVAYSWGGMVAPLYAARHPARVARLILIGLPTESESTSADRNWLLEDPNARSRFNPAIGAYRPFEESELKQMWDKQIPLEDKSAWREEAVLDQHVRDVIEAYHAGGDREPSVPNGALMDVFDFSKGQLPYDPAAVSAPVLILQGDHDAVASVPGSEAFMARFASRQKQLTVVDNATHFLILERCLPRLQEIVSDFLYEQ